MITVFLQHIYIVGTAASVLTGFFLALVFFRHQRESRKISYILSSLMLIFALSVALNAYLSVLMPRAYPRLWSFPEPFLLLIGPLFYIYIQSLSGSFSFTKRALLHFLPFLLAAICFFVFVSNNQQSFPEFKILWRLIALLWLVICIHFWTYYFINHKALSRFREKLKLSRSSIENVYQAWIAYCLMALLICYTILGVLFLLGHGRIFVPINRTLAIVLAVIIYSIGYRTLTQPQMFVDLSEDSDRKEEEKYKRSGLPGKAAKAGLKKVEEFMKSEKPYLDANLDLKTLAAMLNYTSHHLSQIINTGTKLNFYDFVNRYRVEEAKELLTDPHNDHLTILSIAFDAGFNSKATFNRFFKKATQQTPSQFRKIQRR